MKTKQVSITFDSQDAVELYFIINSRGFCPTRSKLLEALFVLDQDRAEKINQNDQSELARIDADYRANTR